MDAFDSTMYNYLITVLKEDRGTLKKGDVIPANWNRRKERSAEVQEPIRDKQWHYPEEKVIHKITQMTQTSMWRPNLV